MKTICDKHIICNHINKINWPCKIYSDESTRDPSYVVGRKFICNFTSFDCMLIGNKMNDSNITINEDGSYFVSFSIDS